MTRTRTWFGGGKTLSSVNFIVSFREL